MPQDNFSHHQADTLLSTKQAAAYLNLSHRTLERLRVEGAGPTFIKLGPGRRATVRYRQADLEAWIESHVFSSTSAHTAQTGDA